MEFDPAIDYRLESISPAELHALTLSEGLRYPLSEYLPVLALTVTRGRDVLITVRDQRTNRTHPDVLSSPTARLRGVPDEAIRSLEWGAGMVPGWLIERVEALLRNKLATDVTVRQDMIVRTNAWQGHSIIGSDTSGRTISEPLTMVNVHIRLPNASASAIPARTDSYHTIRWITRDEHRALVTSHDAASCLADLGAKTPIVYGLCTYSTANMLADPPAGG